MPRFALAMRAAPDQLTLDAFFAAAPVRPAIFLDAPTADIGTLAVRDGQLWEWTLDGWQPPRVPAAHRVRVQQLCGLRDAARAILHAELANADTNTLDALRAALNATYATFRAQFGPLNIETVSATGRVAYPNLASFMADPGYPLVAALEVVTGDDVRTYELAAIFSVPVLRSTIVPDVQTADDALAVSLNATGKVDIEYIAVLLQMRVSAVLEALAGRVLYNPLNGEYETVDVFCAGAVREKLARIATLDADGTRYGAQLAALRAVQPRDLTPADIAVGLGAPWIPVALYAAFADHLLDERDAVTILHDLDTATWKVTLAKTDLRHAARATFTWGTARATMPMLLQLGLNQQTPRFTMRNDEGKYVVDVEATTMAHEKLSAISDEFTRWLWADATRAATLCALYNSRYNGTVRRVYDGSHLTFPGLSTAFMPRPHQTNAVWRSLASGNCLLAHVVGSGKSLSVIMAAMESRRLGLAKKPVIVTPLPVVHQMAREFTRAYPTARLLVVSSDDVSAESIQKFVARIAVGDYDCIIMSHEAFTRVPLSPETRARFMGNQYAAFAAMWDAQGGRGAAVADRAWKTRLEKLDVEAKAGGVFWEMTGIDHIFFDEAHFAKNVELPTRVLGMGGSGSVRAMDLLWKAWYQHERTPSRGVTLATGTPIANSLTETYVWQLMLSPDRLRDSGFAQLDAWLATFAKRETVAELAPAGGYRVKERFVAFQNAPELMAGFLAVVDVVLAGQVTLPMPVIIGGEPEVVAVPASPELAAYNRRLLRRAQGLRRRGGRGRGDNILAVMTDWGKAAVDLRCAVPTAAATTPSKLVSASANIVRLYNETHAERGAQLVFCDIGVAGSATGFSAYEALRDLLVLGGIPAHEIAFVQDATTARARQRMQERVNAGVVRVMIGSTAGLGTGTNMQERAVACHLLDVVWRPCDFEQRIGRIVRQGNTFTRVHVLQYLAEGTGDSYRMQAIERKMRFVAQLLSGDPTVRTVEDVDAVVINFATMKAIATGDRRIIDRAEVDAALTRVARQYRQHEAQRHEAVQALVAMPATKADLTAHVAALSVDVPRLESTTGDAFRLVTVDGDVVTDRAIVGTMLANAFREVGACVYRTGRGHRVTLGRFAGLEAGVRLVSSFAPFELTLHGTTTYATVCERNGEMGVIGLTRRLEHAAAGLTADLAATEAKLARLTLDAAELGRLIAEPNPHAARKAELEVRLTALNTILGIGVMGADGELALAA